MTTYLITRADDLGSFPEANRAIIDAHRNGVLRNASIMVPTPNFGEAAEMARACPDLCLGLHLTLSSEWDQVRWGPVSDPAQVRSLIGEDGNFLPSPLAQHQRGVHLDEMMLELKAQLAIARKAGLTIRYFDEHMGVGWVHPLPQGTRLMALIDEWARDEGVIWYSNIHDGPGLHSRCIPGEIATIEGTLAACDGMTERFPLYMTHPAYLGGALQTIRSRCDVELPIGREAAIRDAEAHLFQDPRFAEGLRARGIQPTSYTEAASLKARAVIAG